MQLLLAILLYLRFIVSPATYEKSHIDLLEQHHQPEIQNVQSDPQQMDLVQREYMGPASQIIVIDSGNSD
jgi:hypothetical protein